ncbi:peptidoglycan-binding protein [Christensenellaceae bacterium OttesenSCG-928-K19]|nr:peptidoglycan-binding protein [Christensenellaceae bacterium OttesenSCG-928-K19]
MKQIQSFFNNLADSIKQLFRPARRHTAGRRPSNTKQKEFKAASSTKVSKPPRERGVGFFDAFISIVSSHKRVSIVVCAAAAAVLIPVIVSANSGIDNSATPAEQATIQETTLPAAQAEELPAAAETAAAQPTPTPEPEPEYLDLVPETYNADVITLQQRLMELYYMDNDEPTDYYGPVTQQAVGYFQRKHGLAIDGVAGEETQDLLFSDEAKSYTVYEGAEGADVTGIQQQLKDLGYPVSVTGYFGTETDKAVRYFQRMNGLTDDGNVGQYTKDLLFSGNAIPSEEYIKKEEEQIAQSNSANKIEAFVQAALAQEGKPYVRGGKGPDTFDCSGLVYYALKASGNGIGYMTSGNWASSGYTTIGSIGELKYGDVICFSGHVGIYIGNGMMVDASSSKGKVVVRGCTSNWCYSNFICGKRWY